MKRVAIVGLEETGKTVVHAKLGDLYSKPDSRGVFMSPKDFGTAIYVTGILTYMRDRQSWPMPTLKDVVQELNWTVKCKNKDGGSPLEVCELSCLDASGELYRKAFGPEDNKDEVASAEVDHLKRFIQSSDYLVVLIDLFELLKGREKWHESIWVTKAILDFALNSATRNVAPRAMIALSIQSKLHEDFVDAYGGLRGALRMLWPEVANNYDWLDVISICVGNKQNVGKVEEYYLPWPDCQSNDLRQIMDWIIDGIADDVSDSSPLKCLRRKKNTIKMGIERCIRSIRYLFDIKGWTFRRGPFVVACLKGKSSMR